MNFRKTYFLKYRKAALAFILVLAVAFCWPLFSDIKRSGGKFSFEPFLLQNLEIVKNENQENNMLLTRQAYSLSERERLNSIYFSFDGKNPNEGFGVQNNLIENAAYHPARYSDSCGYAATFNLLQHKISVRLPKFIFLSRSDSTGDFSIYARLRFSQLRQDMEIFRKIGVFEGRKQGLRASWRDNHVIFEFYNFFWNRNVAANSTDTLGYAAVTTKDVISPKRFYSLLLQYRESDGSLTLLLDGLEQERIYLTSNLQKGGTILIPRFHRWDKSSLIVGENFFGALDELIFSNEILAYQPQAATYGALQQIGARFVQRKGLYRSKRYEMKYSSGSLSNFNMDGDFPPNTRVELSMRASDIPFDQSVSENELPFTKIFSSEQNNSVNALSSKTLQGKYYQWQAELFSDPLGKQTPILKNMRVTVEENFPPAAPRELQVLTSGNDFVVLRFLGNNELDVISGGRYHVYYGIKPYQPLGVLRFEKLDAEGKAIFFGHNSHGSSEQNYITVKISNQSIQDNLLYGRNNPLWRFDYPLLQKNIPMYFWVTAVDNAWNDRQETSDHESAASNVVIARTR